MKNETAEKLFNDQFKFSLNQEVRHKGDSKSEFSNDLGLLILQRNLAEESDDDGNTHFNREYTCRLIRFSGSGDLARFKESELMSMPDYHKKRVEDKAWRDEVHQQMNETKEEVWASFGVTRGTKVKLVGSEIIYKVTGYSMDGNGTELSLREVGGIGSKSGEAIVKSKDEFVIVTT